MMRIGAPRKPWRQKPEPWLHYWPGRPDRRADPRHGVMGVIVYCVAKGEGQWTCGRD